MGRTALYRDPLPFRPARAEVQLEPDVLLLAMPDGRQRRHALDGYAATLLDGFVVRERPTQVSEAHARAAARHGAEHAAGLHARPERRFVRMLILERELERLVIVTPPEEGAVAPSVVRLPQAPDDAAIVDGHAWDALADWIMGGGRLAGCSISDLARLAAIASPPFAVLIGEVAAQRALELVWAARGPLRGGFDLETVLHPLAAAARQSSRVAEALVAALAHAAGATRRTRLA
jgi:hypothetical protein